MVETVGYGPRLVAHPTGALRSVAMVAPPVAIQNARPLEGELNAIHVRACAQQEVLIRTLRHFGCATTLLQAQTADPFASAIADTAIVFENGAAIMRPSAMTRRPESAWIEAQFALHDVPIAGHISAPGLLDGSDVLLVGETAFVARSPRSNALGRNGFAQIAQAHGFRVTEVTLTQNAPPLRAVAGALAHDTVAIAPRYVDAGAFAGFRTVSIEADERGAGVLNVSDHHVIADMRYPRAAAAIRKAGIAVDAIDLHDFGRIGISPGMLAVDLKRV